MIYVISHKESKVCESLGNLFRASLRDNKYKVRHIRLKKISKQLYEPGDICIVIGAARFSNFSEEDKISGVRYALWQTEMLPTTTKELNQSKVATSRLVGLEKILPYYDFYFEHYLLHHAFMSNRGWTIHGCIPLGYHRSLDYTEKFGSQTMKWDALFVGSKSKRRLSQLELIRRQCKLCPTIAVWDVDYYKLILQTKIGLNIHFEDIDTFESWRIMNLMCNRRLVISEPILKSNPLVSGKHFMSASRKDFPNVVGECAKNFSKYQHIADAGYQFIKSTFKFNDSTKKMVERIEKGI
jgi:hypothetical protein